MPQNFKTLAKYVENANPHARIFKFGVLLWSKGKEC